MRVTIEGSKLSFVVDSKRKLEVDVAKMPAPIRAQLETHGAKQKIADAAAGKEGQEAFDAIQQVAENLLAGEWSKRAGGGQSVKDLAIALFRVTGKKSPEELESVVRDADKEVKKGWLANARIKQILLELQQERLAAAAKDAGEVELEVPGLE